MQMPKLTLLIEDDEHMSAILSAVMLDATRDAIVVTAPTRKEAERILERIIPDMILLDLGLPDSAGAETYLRIQNKARHTPIVVITGDESFETQKEIIKLGATDYIRKQDMTAVVLQERIKRAMKVQESKSKLRKGINLINRALTTPLLTRA